MTEFEWAATVREIVVAHSRIDVAELDESHVLARDLGFDSLAFLLTLADLEEKLHFRFPLEEVDHLRDISVGDLVRLIATHRTGQTRGA